VLTDIGSCADRDSHVGSRQRWRVVHAVANHRDALRCLLQLLDLRGLLIGEDFSEHAIDSQRRGHRLRNGASVRGYMISLSGKP
jgi:hypothetical protein